MPSTESVITDRIDHRYSRTARKAMRKPAVPAIELLPFILLPSILQLLMELADRHRQSRFPLFFLGIYFRFVKSWNRRRE